MLRPGSRPSGDVAALFEDVVDQFWVIDQPADTSATIGDDHGQGRMQATAQDVTQSCILATGQGQAGSFRRHWPCRVMVEDFFEATEGHRLTIQEHLVQTPLPIRPIPYLRLVVTMEIYDPVTFAGGHEFFAEIPQT